MNFRANIFRAAGLISLTVCMASGALPQTEERPPAERPAVPNLVLDTIEGEKWSLEENRGSVLVLNFWATWCEPCRTETPLLVKFAGEYEDHGVKIVGVALDDGGIELVKKFVAEYNVGYPSTDSARRFPLRGVENLPNTLLIDPKGRLVKKYVGAVPEKVLREDIEELSKELPTRKQN